MLPMDAPKRNDDAVPDGKVGPAQPATEPHPAERPTEAAADAPQHRDSAGEDGFGIVIEEDGEPSIHSFRDGIDMKIEQLLGYVTEAERSRARRSTGSQTANQNRQLQKKELREEALNLAQAIRA